MLTCIVTRCPGQRLSVLEAGLDLRLCAGHLAALQRMCKGKTQLAYAKLAVREAARLVATGASRRRRRRPVPYECGLGAGWHVGHPLEAGDGAVAPAAREAAAAVRYSLSRNQLDLLTDTWRHGRSQRPPPRGGHATAAGTRPP